MSKVEVKLNYKGVGEYLRSKSVRDLLSGIGTRAVQQLGSGYTVNTKVSAGRVVTYVDAESVRAKKENLKNNTLLKAVQSSV